MTDKENMQSENIYLCEDGKYRWAYSYAMLKNPTVLLLVWKVLMLCGLAPALLVMLADLGYGLLAAAIAGLKVYGIMLLIFIPMGLFSYFIIGCIYGFRYIVLFEMDEKGITHIQQDKQFDKARGIAWINLFLGAAGGNTGMSGRGVMLMTKSSISSDFELVKRVKINNHMCTIKLDQPFSHNQVYVERKDWDFVKEYIISHCPNAKIR